MKPKKKQAEGKSSSEDVYENAKNKALNFISYKLRTEKEVINKLSADYSMEIIEKVLEMLRRYNYVNDENYVRAFVKDRINLHKEGRIKILYMLKQRGIDDLLAENILSNYDFNDEELIIYHLNKRVKNKGSLKERDKIISFLINKGFEYDDVYGLIKQYCQ